MRRPRGMLLQMAYFGPVAHDFNDAIECAFLHFTAWRKQERIPCSQKRFSVKSLVRPGTYGFFLNAKGFNSRVLCQWLLHCLILVNSDPAFQNRDDRSRLAEAALKLGFTPWLFYSVPGFGS